MASVNKAILVGNLCADPETRSLSSGDKVCNMTVATSQKWTDKQSGEKKEKSEFHRVVIFNDNLVRVCENYLKKGSKVYLEGSLQTRKWTDRDGNDKYTTEIVLQRYRGELAMLDGKPSNQSNDERQPRQDAPADDFDDSDMIPF